MNDEIMQAMREGKPLYAAPVYVDSLGYLHCKNAKLYTERWRAEHDTCYQLDLGSYEYAKDYIMEVHEL